MSGVPKRNPSLALISDDELIQEFHSRYHHMVLAFMTLSNDDKNGSPRVIVRGCNVTACGLARAITKGTDIATFGDYDRNKEV